MINGVMMLMLSIFSTESLCILTTSVHYKMLTIYFTLRAERSLIEHLLKESFHVYQKTFAHSTQTELWE